MKAYFGTSRYIWKAMQFGWLLIPGPAHFFIDLVIWKKKKAQYGSCEFDFIWDLLRTIVWEPASQKPLRIFSKEAVGEVNEYIILIKRGYMHSSRHLGRKPRGADIINDCSIFLKIRARNWVHTIFFFKKIFNFLKVFSATFSQSTECLIPDLCPELLSRGIEGQQLQRPVTSSL